MPYMRPLDPRKNPPLAADAPLVTERHPCPACGVPFKIGDLTTLVVLGPGNDPENQAKARAGEVYNAVALPVHWVCATGEEY